MKTYKVQIFFFNGESQIEKTESNDLITAMNMALNRLNQDKKQTVSHVKINILPKGCAEMEDTETISKFDELSIDRKESLIKQSEKMEKLKTDLYQIKAVGNQKDVSVDYILHCLESNKY